jgi:twitching motility protein PilT
MSAKVNTFLELAVNQGGSDLHLVSGEPPRIRINGVLHEVRFRALSAEDLQRLLDEFMHERQLERLREDRAVDFAYDVESLGRFRVNVHYHARGLAAALRLIKSDVPTMDALGLPVAIKTTASQPRGLTLVTGPTGSGKSTTLAAIIDHINANRKGHIITIEDPIEYVHGFKQCIVTQREVGYHSPTFSEALRNAIREDPDVILVGELRDLETIALALTAAETGAQVLGTLHTGSAARTIDRIINVFPAARQDQIRVMLADSLQMVVSQRLLPTPEGDGRHAAIEVLINTFAVASMIRTGNSHKIDSAIQSGAQAGMQSLDSSLKNLLDQGLISGEQAHAYASDKAAFERHIARREAA